MSGGEKAEKGGKREREEEGEGEEEVGVWACGVCTFASNTPSYLSCSVCGTERPSSSSSSSAPSSSSSSSSSAAPRPKRRRKKSDPSNSNSSSSSSSAAPPAPSSKAEAASSGDETEEDDLSLDDEMGPVVESAAAVLGRASGEAFRKACVFALRVVRRLRPSELQSRSCAGDVMIKVTSAFDEAFRDAGDLPAGERQEAFGNVELIVHTVLTRRREECLRRASRSQPSVVQFEPEWPLAGSSVNDCRAANMMDRGVDALYARARAGAFASVEEVELELGVLESRFFEFMRGHSAPGEPTVAQRADYFRRTSVRRLLEFAADEVKRSATKKARKEFLFDWLDTGGDDTETAETETLLIPVEPASAEFTSVQDLFHMSPQFQPPVVAVHRVQNPRNRERFLAHRRSMRDQTTKWLFHGSSVDSVDKIAEDNLDPRLNGTNAGVMFGRGAYMASTSQHSFGYCRPDAQTGHSKMLIVKALVGNYKKVGKPAMVRPPEGFDSVVDNKSNPSQYVVFDLAQLYPAYVVEFDPQPAGAGRGGGAGVFARFGF